MNKPEVYKHPNYREKTVKELRDAYNRAITGIIIAKAIAKGAKKALLEAEEKVNRNLKPER